MSLGCYDWSAYVTERGGGQPLFEIAWSSISTQRVINQPGQATIQIPALAASGANCCEVLENTEPWEHEVVIYRGSKVWFVGPVVTVEANRSQGTIFCNDLFMWMNKRFIEEDSTFSGDVTDIFRELFDLAMASDSSPNITIHPRRVGVDALREFNGSDFTKIGGVMQELARSALDFTMVKRDLLVGPEIFPTSTPSLILHDEGVSEFSVKKDGSSLMTDVAVIGATLTANGEPVTGRATRNVIQYGLLQESVAELTIRDGASADANADARVDSMYPLPLRIQATLTPDAAFELDEAIPGKHMDNRLVSTCIPAVVDARLLQVSTNVSSDRGQETISLEMAPLGVETQEVV